MGHPYDIWPQDRRSAQLERMERDCRQAGYRPCGSWETDDKVCVSSVETWGPTTYNHPRYSRIEDRNAEEG